MESVLPWKRQDDEGLVLKQNEFPAWASNKEYLAYNSPSATFLGKSRVTLILPLEEKDIDGQKKGQEVCEKILPFHITHNPNGGQGQGLAMTLIFTGGRCGWPHSVVVVDDAAEAQKICMPGLNSCCDWPRP